MTKIYTANQPLLFPSIYMMNRYFHSDVLVIMGEAQFTKFGHQSRVEIVTPQGKQYLTVPLKNRSYKALNEVLLADPSRTVSTLKKTLQTVYGRYTGFQQHREYLWDILDLAANCTTLCNFNNSLMLWLWDVLGMKADLLSSLSILPNRPEHPSEWVAELGAKCEADIYLGGATAQQAYIRDEDFKSRGITLRPQSFKMTPYKSVKGYMAGENPGDGWISILDPLFVLGTDETIKLISAPAWEEA